MTVFVFVVVCFSSPVIVCLASVVAVSRGFRNVRGLLGRRRYTREMLIVQSRHMSATKIQAHVKGFFQRRQFLNLRSVRDYRYAAPPCGLV